MRTRTTAAQNRRATTAAPPGAAPDGRGTRPTPPPRQRPAAGGAGGATGEARRIAELEREVRRLKRANATLRTYVDRALDLRAAPRPGDAPAAADPAPDGEPAALLPYGALPGSEEGGGAGLCGAGSGSAGSVALRVLGPIEASVGGRGVELGAPKQRAVLALLVSRLGRPVSVDAMAESLWDGRPPRSALTSLHAYVANLRRALEPDRAPRTPASVLRTRGRGYLLDPRAVTVDALRFGQCATAGRQALDQGDPHRALHAFDEGLALWRGDAYAEAAAAPHVAPEAVRLEELRLSMVEGRCATLVALGGHEPAVPELLAFTRAHPLREYGCELLALALYRAGRQADALAVLRTHQQRMRKELGISPSPALQRLELGILRQAPDLRAPGRHR